MASAEPSASGCCGCRALWRGLKAAVRALKMELLVMYYASQDEQTGCLPKILIMLAIAYALSPLDLIPDFIPLLGLVDDMLLLPLILYLARWSIPSSVLARARERAESEPLRLPRSVPGAIFVGVTWFCLPLKYC